MMIVDCRAYCNGYSRDEGERVCWEGCSVSEDHNVEAQLFTDKRMTSFAALQAQDLAKTILRGEKSVEEWMDARGKAAFPTAQKFLEVVLQEIVDQLKWQQRQGIH